MQCNIEKRLVILNLMPKETSLNEHAISKEIQKKLYFNEDEAKEIEINFNPENGLLKWNKEKDFSKEIDFTINEIIFLKNLIDELDKNKKIREEWFYVCMEIKDL